MSEHNPGQDPARAARTAWRVRVIGLSLASLTVGLFGLGFIAVSGLCEPVTGQPYRPAEDSCLTDLLGMALCCLATLLVPLGYGFWARPARGLDAPRRRFGYCVCGYLLPVLWVLLRW